LFSSGRRHIQVNALFRNDKIAVVLDVAVTQQPGRHLRGEDEGAMPRRHRVIILVLVAQLARRKHPHATRQRLRVGLRLIGQGDDGVRGQIVQLPDDDCFLSGWYKKMGFLRESCRTVYSSDDHQNVALRQVSHQIFDHQRAPHTGRFQGGETRADRRRDTPSGTRRRRSRLTDSASSNAINIERQLRAGGRVCG
jgi:hypothetical protein